MSWFTDPEGRLVEVTGPAGDQIPAGWTLLPDETGRAMAERLAAEAEAGFERAVRSASQVSAVTYRRRMDIVDKLAGLLGEPAGDIADLLGVHPPPV